MVGDDTSRPASRQALETIKQLSGDLGASWHEITSDDPATALVQFAKDHQITQIVLGASRRSRWEQLTSRASVCNACFALPARSPSTCTSSPAMAKVPR